MDCNESLPENSHSTNITSNEIDPETANKLRGDAIGDTMYSEVFVLKTLMQFSDLQWSSKVEEELCFLWDMTEEKDVCQYLLEASYPSLACAAIIKYDEPRFIEIVVGIFANILCSDCDNKSVSEEEIKTVLEILNSDDPLTLVQVMRFLHAISFMYQDLNSIITQETFDKLVFILLNSTNPELVLHCLKALAAVTVDDKIDRNFISEDLFKAVITGYQLVKSNCDSDSQEFHIATKYFIQIMCNICSHIDNLSFNDVLGRFKSEIDLFVEQVIDLLNYFTSEDNLLPVPKELKYYCEALVFIFRVVNLRYNSNIFINICKIVVILSNNSEDFGCISELLCYFISLGKVDQLNRDLKKSKMKKILLTIDSLELEFDFEYKTNLKEVLKNSV